VDRDLAAAAGHTLDWERSAAERNVFVPVAARPGDHEPIHALLTQVAGGTLGVDRGADDTVRSHSPPYRGGRRVTSVASGAVHRDGEAVAIPILAPAADATDDDLLQLFLIPARFQPIRSVFRVAQGRGIDPTGKA
jgi:hypothetical protein